MLKKFSLLDFLLVTAFIISISAASISNYKASSLILKAAVNFILLLLIFFDFKLSRIKNKSILQHPESRIQNQESRIKNPASRIQHLAPVLLLLFPLLTLIYSSNLEFGIQKWVHLLIGIIPLIFAVYYFISVLDKEWYKNFLYILITEALLCSIFILILSPFTYDGKYAILSLQWSHVIVGRFLSIVFLLTLFYMFEQQEKRKIIFLNAVLMFLLFALIFTGLRAALLGIAIIILIIDFIFIFRRLQIFRKKSHSIISHKSKDQAFIHFGTRWRSRLVGAYIHSLINKFFNLSIFQSLYFTLLIFNFSFLIVLFASLYLFPSERFDNLTAAENLTFRGDGAILSRLDAWESAWEMIKEKPFWGYGLGGYKTDFPPNNWIKYPHNIFLEIQVELGIVGTVLFFLFIYKIFSIQFPTSGNQHPATSIQQPASSIQFPASSIQFTTAQPSATGYQVSSIRLFLVFTLILAFFSKDIATQTLLWLFIPFIVSNSQVRRDKGYTKEH